jgi:hypothetical protein
VLSASHPEVAFREDGLRPGSRYCYSVLALDYIGVTGYEVLRDGVVVASVTSTRMRERNLPANMEGCYTVRAVDAIGNRSQPAGPACARTADPTQVP